jgi:hypothetical protein
MIKTSSLLSTQDRNNGRAGYVFYQDSAGNFSGGLLERYGVSWDEAYVCD